MSRRSVATTLVIAGAVLACGPSTPPPSAPIASAAPRERRAVISAEQEIGGLDELAVQHAFERSAGSLSRCFNKGAERLPLLAGEVHFKVRITKSGAARWAFVKDSTLGDRETEECMLGALKAMTWPKPLGGEGIAENSFSFESGGDERPPVALSPHQLGDRLRRARPELARCRTTAGTGALKATMYVDPAGKPSAVGIASADERGEAAAACIVGVLKGITFPSPGSYAAKVSIAID